MTNVTPRQKKHVTRLMEDALDATQSDKDGLQRLANRGGEFKEELSALIGRYTSTSRLPSAGDPRRRLHLHRKTPQPVASRTARNRSPSSSAPFPTRRPSSGSSATTTTSWRAALVRCRSSTSVSSSGATSTARRAAGTPTRPRPLPATRRSPAVGTCSARASCRTRRPRRGVSRRNSSPTSRWRLRPSRRSGA